MIQKGRKCDGKGKQIGWKERFKKSIYHSNWLISSKNNGQKEKSEKRNLVIQKAIQVLNRRNVKVNSVHEMFIPHGVYIPLSKSISLDDELMNTVPFLKDLQQDGKDDLRVMYSTRIADYLKQCSTSRERMKIGWKWCLKKILPEIDVIQKMSIYVRILKFGVDQLIQYHESSVSECKKQILLREVMKQKKYFEQKIGVNQSSKLSVEIDDQINEVTMGKTLKMLYCSICLLYDCNRHKLEQQVFKKNYHYQSPKNIIPLSQHIAAAARLCNHFKQLQSQSLKPSDKSSKCACSHCYLKLKQLGDNIGKNKNILLTPMNEGLIKIGIQLFSYNPCRILNLFNRQQRYGKHKVTCSMIFFYFIEEYDLFSRLEIKLQANQLDFLEKATELQQKSTARKYLFQKQKKTPTSPRMQTEALRCSNYSVCFHYYVGEEGFDQTCKKCQCAQRGFCLPECLCSPECQIMYLGCSCKGKNDCMSSKCPCYRSRSECIASRCFNCFPNSSSKKKNQCNNTEVMRDKYKLIRVGRSTIPSAGLGAFAGENIEKGQLVSVYVGQIIQSQISKLREIQQEGGDFYMFQISQNYTIDARYLGNRARFINHQNEKQQNTNLLSVTVKSEGKDFIGLYASRNIKKGQQLFFDYDVYGSLKKNYGEKYPFLGRDTC